MKLANGKNRLKRYRGIIGFALLSLVSAAVSFLLPSGLQNREKGAVSATPVVVATVPWSTGPVETEEQQWVVYIPEEKKVEFRARIFPDGAIDPMFLPIEEGQKLSFVTDNYGQYWLRVDDMEIQYALPVTYGGKIYAAVAQGPVAYCENVRIVITDTLPFSITMDVLPGLPVPPRKVIVESGEERRWGCEFPFGVIWSSIAGHMMNVCQRSREFGGDVVQIVGHGEGVIVLVSDFCLALRSPRILWLDKEGKVVSEQKIEASGGWIGDDSRLCVFGGRSSLYGVGNTKDRSAG